MGKSLSERIAERAAKKKPSRSGQNRAAFLALKSDVKSALDDGWSVKVIWATLHEEGKVAFSYQAFRAYVNKLILARKEAEQPPRVDQTKAGQVQPMGARPAKPAAASTPTGPVLSAGFNFQSQADKKELL